MPKWKNRSNVHPRHLRRLLKNEQQSYHILINNELSGKSELERKFVFQNKAQDQYQNDSNEVKTETHNQNDSEIFEHAHKNSLRDEHITPTCTEPVSETEWCYKFEDNDRYLINI